MSKNEYKTFKMAEASHIQIGIKELDDLNLSDIIFLSQNQEIKDEKFDKFISQLPGELKIKYFCRCYYHRTGVKLTYRIIGILKNKYVVYSQWLFSGELDFSTEEYDYEWQIFYYKAKELEMDVRDCVKKKDLCKNKRECFHEFSEVIIPKVIINIIDDYLLWFDEYINFALYYS